MRNPILSAFASAPVAALLAVISASLTIIVAVRTLSAGQAPSDAGLELIAALLLAAVAASEASRPQRRDRGRKRQIKDGQTGHGQIAPDDELSLGRGVDVDLL